MEITISTDRGSPDFVARRLYQLADLAQQEPRLALKMIEFLNAGIGSAFSDISQGANDATTRILLAKEKVDKGVSPVSDLDIAQQMISRNSFQIIF